MKNKIIIAILVVLMLVPSIVAIINYNTEQAGAPSTLNVVSMHLTDPLGNTFDFYQEGSEEEKKMINYFISAPEKAEELDSLPVTIENGNYYRLTVNTTASESTYKYYYTSNAEDCYFADGEGKTYLMATNKAEEFLATGYAAFLYEYGTAPVLSVTGQAIVPDACSWNFINSAGKYTEAIVKLSGEEEPVKLEGGFAMEFSNKPDSFTVKLTNKDSGEVIFDDIYDNIPGVIINDDMKVKAEITAKWYEDKTRNYYGEQTYVFEASLSAPAAFYSGANTIELGEFICVTAVNVNNPADIKFSSEPAIDFQPKFYKQEDGCSYALIPFEAGLEAGHYTLSFSYGGASQNVNIDVVERTNAPIRPEAVNKTYDQPTVNSSYSDEAISKAQETLLPIAQSSVEKIHFNGGFVSHPDNTIKSGFGQNVSINGTDKTFIHTGIDVSYPAGTDIVAMNAGEVVYAGYLDHTGFIVVVDHGIGLKSWYAHLGECTVKVGDVVKAGDKVGTAGNSGFINITGAHVGMTVFDVPVCQYAVWDNGKYAEAGTPGVPVYKAE